ncbi:MAG TPA: phospholipid carrier-dependent glycosyltransferase [Tepidisphaeraceae bacterium]
MMLTKAQNDLGVRLERGAQRRFAWADSHFWLAMLLVTAVVFPRSAMISWSQSERVDDEYHLRRGIHYLKRHFDGEVTNLPLNDPPLGEGLSALPLAFLGCWPRGLKIDSGLWGYRVSADGILLAIALWKALLFLPCAAIIFNWVRRVYGVGAGWLAVGLVLIEPTIAGHLPLPTLDVLGVEGIVIGCWCWWRFFEVTGRNRTSEEELHPHPRPLPGTGEGVWWLVVGSVATAIALMLKHTAVILPGVAFVMGVMWWVVKPWREGWLGESWRGVAARRVGMLVAAPIICFLVIWALCFFDYGKPPFPLGWAESHPGLAKLLDRKMPASIYIGSFLEGHNHSQGGHEGFLFGEKMKKRNSRWYYFPVVAYYKVPVGIAGILLLAIFSYWKAPFRWQEWGLVIPMVAWGILMITSKINIGWRHFLPCYIFTLLMASRVALLQATAWKVGMWCSVVVAAGHVLSYHPDYFCYINWPRYKPYLQISDSNVDWGQGLKDARKWIVAHPNRKVFVRDFGWGPDRLFNVKKRVGDVATVLDRGDPLPREGVLIISPVPVAGVYERSDPFRVLRDQEPDAVLGHSMLVYDLDRMRNGKAFYWPKYRPTPNGPDGKPRPAAEGSPKNEHPWG